MPRNAKITGRLRQQWLDRSEGGKLEAAIANESGYTERAVKEHIERARIERDWRSARLQQMKEALGAHHQDLLGVLDATDRLVMRVIDELLPQDGLVMRSGPVRWEEDARGTARAVGAAVDEPVGILAPGRVDSYPAVRFEGVRAPDGGKQWKIAFGNEGWLLWRSLREHLRRSPLWGGPPSLAHCGGTGAGRNRPPAGADPTLGGERLGGRAVSSHDSGESTDHYRLDFKTGRRCGQKRAW